MDAITQYLQLAAQRPELFRPSEQIPLCLDENTLRSFSNSTGAPLGVVYDNSPYYLVVADLCVRSDGALYPYARVIYPYRDSSGVVVIPCRDGRFEMCIRDRWRTRCGHSGHPCWNRDCTETYPAGNS